MNWKRFGHVTALLAGLALGGTAPENGYAAEGDEAILSAHAAYRAGDAAALERHARSVAGHVLESYVAYWRLRLRIEDASTDAVRGYAARFPGSYLADRLREDWLKELGRRSDWAGFEAELHSLVRDDLEVRCYAWLARWARGDRSVLPHARGVWLTEAKLPEGCDTLASTLIERGALDRADIVARARALFELRRVSEAQLALQQLPSASAPAPASVSRAWRSPESVLQGVRVPRHGSPDYEVAVLALIRLAAKDPVAAAEFLEGGHARSIADADRRYLWGRIALEAARRHDERASRWYARADEARFTDEQHAWRVRAALRRRDWTGAREAIDRMPHDAHREPAWSYWYGRALAAQGSMQGARAYFARIAGQPDFYGLLATEALGEVHALPAAARPASASEIADAGRDPGLQRALALFRIGLRREATREWTYSIRTMDDRQLLAASAVALKAGVYDRTINTADRTQQLHDFSLRYLAPFRDVFREYASAQGLDPDWVLGLVRQESRFIVEAKSVAGARGLMQLMPRTASWVARRIGLRDFSLRDVMDVETNVTLGTGYLKMVLDDLGHPVLASAAYNAGPGRARRWRDGQAIEGAIYAETIPFDETRDYVKKVMANAVFYGLLDGRSSTLTARLGTVGARQRGERVNGELP